MSRLKPLVGTDNFAAIALCFQMPRDAAGGTYAPEIAELDGAMDAIDLALDSIGYDVDDFAFNIAGTAIVAITPREQAPSQVLADIPRLSEAVAATLELLTARTVERRPTKDEKSTFSDFLQHLAKVEFGFPACVVDSNITSLVCDELRAVTEQEIFNPANVRLGLGALTDLRSMLSRVDGIDGVHHRETLEASTRFQSWVEGILESPPLEHMDALLDFGHEQEVTRAAADP